MATPSADNCNECGCNEHIRTPTESGVEVRCQKCGCTIKVKRELSLKEKTRLVQNAEIESGVQIIVKQKIRKLLGRLR